MSQAHGDMMNILLGVIALLAIIVLTAIVGSLVRNKKKTKITSDQSSNQPSNKPSATLLSDSPEPLLNKEALVQEKETKLSEALAKTEEHFFGRIKKAFLNLDSSADKKAVLEEVEEVLYTSDLGSQTVEKLLEVIRSELSSKEMTSIDSVKVALKNEMTSILQPQHHEAENKTLASELMHKAESGPTVIMIVGVNGAGKTTSIGKITAQLAEQGHRILVAAGDTFRAAAGGQLKVWTDRAQSGQENSGGHVEIYWPEKTADPSAVAFEALTKAKSQNFDYVLIDTAGRLHTQTHLMEELKKVKRVMTKVIPEAPHETWIVLDANSGQNALIQAKEYHQALTLTGVILTKMDGTAKGGVALAVVDQVKIPIKLIGIGEKIKDLKVFNHKDYTNSVLGLNS